MNRRSVKGVGDARSGRIAFVDGLRACAALSVVGCHTAMIVPAWTALRYAATGVPLAWLGHIAIDGAHGVDLFFVLSGFCLAYPTLRRVRSGWGTSFDVVRYAAHRAVRILPPYYAALAATLLLGAVLTFHYHRFVVPGADPFDVGDVLRQLAFIDYRTALVNPPFWTLIVELRWYFVFPLALYVWFRAPRLLGLGIGAVAFAYAFTRLHDLDLGVLPAFLLGIVAADVEITQHPIRRHALLLCALSLAMAALLEPSTVMPNSQGVDERSFLWQTNPGWQLAAFFFVIAAGHERWLRRALSWAPLVALGVCSYSLYLVHYPVIMLVGPHLMHPSPAAGFGATVAAAVVCGSAFWWLVERHFCSGALRDRIVAALVPRVRWAFAWAAAPAGVQYEPSVPSILAMRTARPNAIREAGTSSAAAAPSHSSSVQI